MKFLAASLLTAVTAIPSQVHIALAGQDANGVSNGMNIAWKTEGNSAPLTSVKYSFTSVSVLDQTVTGTARNYLEDYGFHHQAIIQDIPCATSKVHYQVGGDADGWSEVFSFKPAPCSYDPIKVSIFGDMGYLDSEQRPMLIALDGLEKVWSATYTRETLETLKNEEAIDFVWLLGDIGYIDDSFSHTGSVVHFTYEETYDGYMQWMQNISATMPLMVLPGNHESGCHDPSCVTQFFKYGKHLMNFTAYNERWHMPSKESGGSRDTNMWYSFNYGPVHFVSINCETDFPGAGEEFLDDSGIPYLKAGGFGAEGEFLAWLEADLAKADAGRKAGGRPWIVVGGHRPYNTAFPLAGDLFQKYGVDMYFAGHSHSYSRTLSDGLAWIVVGGAGCEEMGPPASTLLFGPEGVETITSDRYSSGVLEATEDELYWRLIDSENGEILDELRVGKQYLLDITI